MLDIQPKALISESARKFLKRKDLPQLVFQVFNEGALKGYAAAHHAPDNLVTGIPHGKIYESFCDGGWRVMDWYQVSPISRFCHGMTQVDYCTIPVFVMQYRGRYEKEATPFLKKALRAAYDKHEFNGGRGPTHFTDGNMRYQNDVVENNLFLGVSGHEWIWRNDGQPLGELEYNGIYLIAP